MDLFENAQIKELELQHEQLRERIQNLPPHSHKRIALQFRLTSLTHRILELGNQHELDCKNTRSSKTTRH